MSEEHKRMTTDAGRPMGDNQNSLTVGPRGPVVFEDILLFEKMAHFNRERIPERIVHAKGSHKSRYGQIHDREVVFRGGEEDVYVSALFDRRRREGLSRH